MSTPAIDFSDLGAKPVQASGPSVDFSDLGGKPVGGGVGNASQSTPEMRAGTSEPWLNQVEDDLRSGGGRTVVGRTLGYLQGRGDQGYTGLEGGQGKGAADVVAGVPLGAVKFAQGASEGDPLKMVGGSLQMATVPAAFMGGPAIEAGANELPPAIARGVSALNFNAQKQAAGALLQSVAADANKVPVELENSSDAALKLMDWQKKTNLGPTINKYLNRITSPTQGPLTYEDARDYYQLLTKLSSDETSKLAPTIQRTLGEMVSGLRTDIGNAADQVGRAADYEKGLGDYAKASKYGEWYNTAKDWGIKAAAGAAFGTGGTAAYKLWQWMTGK